MKHATQLLLAVFCLWGLSTVAQTATVKTPEAATYQIRNVRFGDLLRPRDANSANGTPIVLYPGQPWKCMTWRLTAAGSSFQLKNLFTSKTFCAGGSTNDLQQPVLQQPLPKNAEETAGWQLTPLPGGRYKIADAKSGKVLTAVKDENTGGLRTVAAAWQDTDEQKWQLEKMDPKELTM